MSIEVSVDVSVQVKSLKIDPKNLLFKFFVIFTKQIKILFEMKAPMSELVRRILGDRRLAKEFMGKVIRGARSEDEQVIEVDGKKYRILSGTSPELVKKSH